METHATERKAVRLEHGVPPQPELEHLPCPRCNSTNTKFCYYNNYNFSQPRHFCKSCRRYWTRGGALRDIPVGGGIRKNTKRSPRTVASAVGLSTEHDGGGGGVSQLRSPFAFESVHGVGAVAGSFTSLLSTQEAGAGAWTVGGYRYGFGLDDVGFGLGRSFWPVYGLVDVGPDSGSTSLSSVAGRTWQEDNDGAGD